MKIEIEIKLRLPADLDSIRRTLRRLGFHLTKRRAHESNILFDNPKKTLRKHGRLIRVRRVGSESLLTYKGPSQSGRYKKREEVEVDLSDGVAIALIFGHIGYHPVFRYEKFRTEYSRPKDTGKVLLDETPIGNFLELEGSARWIDRTARELGYSPRDYITRSYGYLYLSYCRERRITPKDMLFKKTKQSK